MLQVFYKAEVGFEPTNRGFAIRSLSPLGYSAVEWTGYLAFGCMATDHIPPQSQLGPEPWPDPKTIRVI